MMELEQVTERYYETEKKVILGDMGKYPFQISPLSLAPACASSVYAKGYPLQPEACLGGQVYEKHQCTWLRSVDSEEGALKLRNGDAAGSYGKLGFTDLHRGSSSDVMDGVEREHMFDKVVTPSDVGKLNRLVIPKQHAEKYFPLDSTANEKGLLLNFEDRSGKMWRFRYSYWNSSQSYVMTKGWSRFVKEKKLDAGDIVSFERSIGESASDRLFIDWKRRSSAAAVDPALQMPFHQSFSWSHGLRLLPAHMNMHHPHLRYHHHHHHGYKQQRQRQSLGYGSSYSHGYNHMSHGRSYVLVPRKDETNDAQPMVQTSEPVVLTKEEPAKRLRLFGINLDFPTSNDADAHGNCLSPSTASHAVVSSYSPHSPDISLQLRLSNGASFHDLLTKGKPSLSLDLEI